MDVRIFSVFGDTQSKKLLELEAKKPWLVMLNDPDVMTAYRQTQYEQIEHVINKTGQIAKNGVVFSAVILNFWNVWETERPNEWDFDFSSGSKASQKTASYISNAAYLGQSMVVAFSAVEDNLFEFVQNNASINQGKKFFAIEASVGRELKPLLTLSRADAIDAYGKSTGDILYNSIKKYRFYLAGLGALTLIATVFELVTVIHQLRQDRNVPLTATEYALTAIKGTSLLIMAAGSTYQIVLSTSAFGGFAWAMPVVAAAGIIYLIVAAADFYFSRDEIDFWLAMTRFGHSPNNDWSGKPILEYQALQDLLLKPQVYAETTIRWEELPSLDNSNEPQTLAMVTGYWVVLYLPGINWLVEVAELEQNIFFDDEQIVNEKIINNAPRYISKGEYESIRDKGLPQDFSAQEQTSLEDDSVNTGLYLYALPFIKENDQFVLKLQQKHSSKQHKYRIKSKNLQGGIIKSDDDIQIASNIKLNTLLLQPFKNKEKTCRN